MKDLEIKLFYLLTFVFLILTVALGIKVEALKNDLDVQRHNETPTENIPTVSDSLCNGACCCVEGLR